MTSSQSDLDAAQEPVGVTSQCGFIAIVGRPNVGKSTLLNHLIQQKISITSRKPQTTRHNVIGIKTEKSAQLVFVDTPGIHRGHQKAINRAMNRAATTALQGVDIIVFVVDKDQWTEQDDVVREYIHEASCPVIVAVNKLDQMASKNEILPWLSLLHEKMPGAELVPISALKNQNIERLQSLILQKLPRAPFHYPEDQITDRSMRFMAAEIIREKITRQMGAELPYQVAVEIEEFTDEARLKTIGALIWVEREGQKRILVGDGGCRLKSIGQQARQDMEKLFAAKVMLNLWVKVKSGWSDSERALRSLGFDNI